MNWNEVICPVCGLVNNYNVTEKANNSVCTCNGCGKFLGNKPKTLTGQRMPFGKHKGKLISDVAIIDYTYLLWFLKECHTKLNTNCITAIKTHIK